MTIKLYNLKQYRFNRIVNGLKYLASMGYSLKTQAGFYSIFNARGGIIGEVFYE
jgi:hypothetical protein